MKSNSGLNPNVSYEGKQITTDSAIARRTMRRSGVDFAYDHHLKKPSHLSHTSDDDDEIFTPPKVPWRTRMKQKIFKDESNEETAAAMRQEGIQPRSPFFIYMYRFVNTGLFGVFITLTIVLNTVVLVIQTYQNLVTEFRFFFTVVEMLFIAVYTFEAACKIIALRRHYFKSAWNWLDFTIVLSTYIFDIGLQMLSDLMPGRSLNAFKGISAFRTLRVFRAFRALRALRVLQTFSFLSNLQVIMTTILKSVKAMLSIAAMMLLFLYMFSVTGRSLFYSYDSAHWSSLWLSFLSLFQLLTMDDWFILYRKTTGYFVDTTHTIIVTIFVLLFIICEYFIFLNLFVAVLVDNFQIAMASSVVERRAMVIQSELAKELESRKATERYTDMSTTPSEMDSKKRNNRTRLGDATMKEDVLLEQHLRMLASLEWDCHRFQCERKFLEALVDNALTNDTEND